ncbi:biopolymer transporter ExbD [Polyangium sp. 15x6]|nr:biopolymer transporter ExbD [Polyangium sp. 15x6]
MGARVKSGSSKKQPEPEINITPLVDVVLVLLIIFMVIAPELEHGERVELPTVIQPDENKSKLDPITVTLTARGNLFLEKEVLADVPALEARLKAMHGTEPDRRVVLKGDATVQYAKMRDAFAACQRAGYTGVALSVSQKGKSAGEES